MSTEYPDVLGDLVEARQRFEVNGVHYVTTLDPTTISPGETAYLRFWLQSCWDVPVEVAIGVQLPTQPVPTFSIIQKRTDVPLEPAEVGEVTIPLACAAQTEPSEYIIKARVGAQLKMVAPCSRNQSAKPIIPCCFRSQGRSVAPFNKAQKIST